MGVVHSLFAVMSQSAFSVSDFPAEEFAEAHKMRKEKKLKRAKKVHGSEKQVTMFGKETVKCRRGVRILVGPVIGKVTATTAIVLVEVDASSSIHLHLVPESGDSIVIEKHFDERIPSTFYVQNLQSETSYQVAIGGVEGKFVRRHTGLVKTFSESPQKLRVAVVSCDRPERHLAGEELMWKSCGNEFWLEKLILCCMLVTKSTHKKNPWMHQQSIVMATFMMLKLKKNEARDSSKPLYKLVID